MLDKLPNDIIKIIIKHSTITDYRYKFKSNEIYNTIFTVIEINNLIILSKKIYKNKEFPEYILKKDYDYPISYLHQPW